MSDTVNATKPLMLQKDHGVVTLQKMPVTGATIAGREENFRQIDRLVGSNLLHGSESLSKLLRFLADQAVDHPGTPIKEYQIATEVFGRPSYFDPRLDSTVRVQTGRLRSKLAEFYAGEGSNDPIIVEIPKGSYTLVFHERPAPAPVLVSQLAEEAAPPKAPPPVLPKPDRTRGLLTALIVLSTALACTTALLTYVTFAPASAHVVTPKPESAEPFRSFWKGFIESGEFPWIVFSNAEFVGRPETGMRYFDPEKDTPNAILDHYTGVGEVLAIHELDRLFTGLNHGVRVKRGRLLSLDDVKNNNLIFVGSPIENLSLREIPASHEFIFRRAAAPKRNGDLAIVNVHPQPAEQLTYLATARLPLAEDYAVIALGPGINQSHSVLLLAGTTTIGTQGAVEYVCRGQNLEAILSKLTGSKTGSVVPFEAVLRIQVLHGVPVDTQIVALHKR